MKSHQQILKEILDIIYQNGVEYWIQDIISKGYNKNDIEYLRTKNFIEPSGRAKSLESNYTSFAITDPDYVKITAQGIDFLLGTNVEEERRENKITHPLQINVQNNSTNSNTQTFNPGINVSSQELTPEVLKLLQQVKTAVEKKEKEKIPTLMDELRNASTNIFCGVVSSGIFQFLAQNLPK